MSSTSLLAPSIGAALLFSLPIHAKMPDLSGIAKVPSIENVVAAEDSPGECLPAWAWPEVKPMPQSKSA